MMKDGSIGTMHGQMLETVRNPFRSKFMRKNFEAALKTYDAKHKNFIYPSGRRCLGNAWANNFWRGFDNAPMNWEGSKDTAAYAMYRAGQEVAKVVNSAQETVV